jgi:hypothetical protein
MQAPPHPPIKDEDEAPIPPETVSNAANMTASNSLNMNPTEVNEAPIPPETVSNSLNMNPIEEPEAIIPMEIVSSGSATTTITVAARRTAPNRTESWYIPPPTPPRRSTRQRQLPGFYTSPPQDDDMPAARKKRRLEEYLPTIRSRTRSTTIDEAARKTASHGVSEGHSPSAVDDDGDDDTNADADPVSDTQANDGATGSWTLEEDAKLTSAVANTDTCKKKRGKVYKTDWPAISALVPSRTLKQCQNRWHNGLNPSIALAAGHEGKWTEDEDSNLKDAVQTHGGKNWGAVASLVPSRTKKQCWSRWHDALNPSIALAAGREGKWTQDEDSKLKDSVQTHGGKNWKEIAVLVPGRTRIQCRDRWKDGLDPSINRANRRTGKWAEDEANKLKDAVQTHGGNNWAEIAALVPGRTAKQCGDRWKNNRST